MLANKCGISARLDFFSLKPTNKFGDHFRLQLEDKLSHPDNNELGKKNIEEMETLVAEMENEGEYLADKKRVKLN